MDVEHLAIYYDRVLGYVVDIEPPDDPDGSRAAGTSGWRFDTLEEVCNVVMRWFTTQVQQRGEHHEDERL